MVELDAICCCSSIGAPPETRLCPVDHRYWKGDKELQAVSRLIKKLWPIKPDYSKAQPDVLDNARDRGIEVDVLFSRYVAGQLDAIPRGTREDARDLFFKVRRWWDYHKHGEVRSQVILSDDEIAGTCDILDDDWIWDLKTTYNIEAFYPLQLAAYAELHFKTFGRPAKGIGIIHLTKRFPEPKIVKIDMLEAMQDWQTLRSVYSLVEKRAKGKLFNRDEDWE